MRTQAVICALVLGLATGCEGNHEAGDTPERAETNEKPGASPGSRSELNTGDGIEANPDIDEAAQVEPPIDIAAPASSHVALRRRAELQPSAAAPAPRTDSAVFQALQCAELSAVAGRLDAESNVYSNSSFRFLYDTYVITARSSGTMVIASSVQPIGASYRYGYGFPLSAQAIAEVDGAPALTPSLVANSAVLDNALDDGEARLSLEVEAGKQYMVTYKGLVGPASPGSAWTYTLGFCAGDLAVEGKLWVSPDAEDLVPVEPLAGPISVANAPAGAMSRLAEDLQVAP